MDEYLWNTYRVITNCKLVYTAWFVNDLQFIQSDSSNLHSMIYQWFCVAIYYQFHNFIPFNNIHSFFKFTPPLRRVQKERLRREDRHPPGGRAHAGAAQRPAGGGGGALRPGAGFPWEKAGKVLWKVENLGFLMVFGWMRLGFLLGILGDFVSWWGSNIFNLLDLRMYTWWLSVEDMETCWDHFIVILWFFNYQISWGQISFIRYPKPKPFRVLTWWVGDSMKVRVDNFLPHNPSYQAHTCILNIQYMVHSVFANDEFGGSQ